METIIPDHYATLGLHRGCTIADIRRAYRLLAKTHHPDVNPLSPDAMARTQALNEAYHTLSNSSRRKAYDDQCAQKEKASATPMRPAAHNITQDVRIGVQDFIRGLTLGVRVVDPGNPTGAETYELVIPPETAPGSRFRIRRQAPCDAGFVVVRVKARPDMRFSVRGSDVLCKLNISVQRASQGGTEYVRGVAGHALRVHIPAGVARNSVVKIAGEGLPKPRGGRGYLCVRIMYRPEVRIQRGAVTRSVPRPRGLLK